MSGWIGVDLDGTLAHYDGWKGSDHIGAPVPAMLARVKAWLADGHEVRIFTARVWPLYEAGAFDTARFLADNPWKCRTRDAALAVVHIQEWCKQHVGRVLPITCVKDFGMVELWDDRCVQVRPNTGEPVALT